jgi:DNA-binding LytR/AlgR family response regulator
MDIQLSCSEQIREKIHKTMTKAGISISENARIALVERGFEMPPGKLAIVFDPTDYMEAVEILKHDAESKPPAGSNTVTGFSNNRYWLIQVQDINHIDAHGSEITCHTDQETYYLKNNLQYYEDALGCHGVIRINKSQLINLRQVKEIIPWFNARLVLVLRNSQRLEVSKRYSKILRKTLNM